MDPEQTEEPPMSEDTGPDAADTRAYTSGHIEYDEYTRRCHDRHGGNVTLGGSIDPVGIYDAMHEAGTSLMGSYLWLERHAPTEDAALRWRHARTAVHHQREQVDARDTSAQRRATIDFVAQERAVYHMVLV